MGKDLSPQIIAAGVKALEDGIDVLSTKELVVNIYDTMNKAVGYSQVDKAILPRLIDTIDIQKLKEKFGK